MTKETNKPDEADEVDDVAKLIAETVELSKRWRAYGAMLSKIDLQAAVQVLHMTLSMQDNLRTITESLAEHSHLPDNMPELKFE
jgi:hypothetical protein